LSGSKHKAGKTVVIECLTKFQLCSDTPGTGGMKFSRKKVKGNSLTFVVDATIGPGCNLGLPTPQIDYKGTFKFTKKGKSVKVSFKGKVDDFPAYEAYAHEYGGKTRKLFVYGPAGPLPELVGEAHNPVRGSVKFKV